MRRSKLVLNCLHAANTMETWSRKIYTVWLFTFSDIKTIIVPSASFGLMYAHCAPLLGMQIPTASLFRRLIFTTLWVWLNLVPFTISNQVQPLAIKEDILNKPWRPIPSGRLAPTEAKIIMISFYFVATSFSIFLLGGWRQCFMLMMLGYWYNNLEGAGGLVSKNLINACGYLCFATGSYEVALGSPLLLQGKLLAWLVILWIVIFSTVQTQDMFDQSGDAVYKRKTLPLVVGDANARWITAWAMLFWSVYCPLIWHMDLIIHLAFFLHGSLVALRLLRLRTLVHDKMTFRIWNIWILFLYSLPFLKYVFWLECNDQYGEDVFLIRTSSLRGSWNSYHNPASLLGSTIPILLLVLLFLLTSAMIGFTNPRSPIRMAGLPIAMSITWTTLQTASLNMRSTWASLFCGTTVGFFLQYFDRCLLSCWSFETGGPSKNPNDGVAPSNVERSAMSKPSPISPGTASDRLRFGLWSALSFRSVNTPWETKNTPKFCVSDPTYVPSRSRFLVNHLVIASICYLYLDLIQQANELQPKEEIVKNFSPDMVPFYNRLDTITSEQLQISTVSTFVYWASMYAVMQGFTSFCALLIVGCGIDEPKSWRPLFGSPFEAYTLRRFWRCVSLFQNPNFKDDFFHTS